MPSYIQKNILLAPYTTLGVGGYAEYFGEITSREELMEAVSWAEKEGLRVTILGGGSNVLVPDSGVRGVVIHMCIGGITYSTEHSNEYVTVGAGVLLDTLVEELVTNEYWGLENFSAIPGTVGAVPIQNVGAYGVEAQDVIDHVTVYDSEQHTIQTLTNEKCLFGYRDSLFKQTSGKKYFVLDVTFRIAKRPNPKLEYKDLSSLRDQVVMPTLRDVRNTIIHIRAQKFPDWNTIGTAGSFFKNPHITEKQYAELIRTYPGLPGYRTESGMVKVSLGWILDHVCALKGFTQEGIGLYEKQALVLVCARGTSASAIEYFSQNIIDRIFEATHIRVEREVTVLE